MAYYFISILWVIVVVATFHVLYQNKLIVKNLFSIKFSDLFYILLISLVIIIAITNLFYGLEYEDAYEYLYSGNLLANNSKIDFNGLNPICILGSTKNLILQSSLSHPAGYAVLLSLLIKLFGFWLFWGHFCSILFFLLSLFFVYLIGLKSGIQEKSLKYGIIFLVLSPSLILFGISGFSETASSFLIIFLLLQLQDLLVKGDNYRFHVPIINYLYLSSTFALAILVRRDNIVLFIVVILAIIFGFLQKNRLNIDKIRFLLICISLSFGIIFANIASSQNILNFYIIQVPGAAAFSLNYFKVLAPMFLVHISNPLIFGIVFPFFAISFFLPHIWRKLTIIPITTFIYIVLCLTFAHSYYFIYSKEIPFIHFERYLLQIWPLIALQVAMAIDTIVLKISNLPYLSKIRPRIFYSSIISIICICLVYIGYQRRSSWAKEERLIRYYPYLDAMNAIPSKSWLIVGEPILIDLWSDGKKNIVDYCSIGKKVNSLLLKNIMEKNDIYLFLPENSIKKPEKRYQLASSIISEYQITFLKKYQIGNRYFILSKIKYALEVSSQE